MVAHTDADINADSTTANKAQEAHSGVVPIAPTAPTAPLFTRIVGTIAVIASILWFGLTFSSQIAAYDLFVTGTPDLRPLDTTLQLHTIRIVSNMTAGAAAAFVVALPAFVVFMIRRRPVFASRGYYMMAVALAVALIPTAAFSAWQGWSLYTMFPDHTLAMPEVLPQVLPVFTSMYTTRGWTHFVSETVYITIVAVFILRPLLKAAKP
ncbi:MAG: hypothetical protein ACK45R_01795 [Candidatus Kapaibacterium sp.]|jgi:hypothetical protein